MKFINKSHLKLYRIGDLFISGGMNLCNSDYTDICFTIDDKEVQMELINIFNDLWKKSSYVATEFLPIPHEEQLKINMFY